MSAAASTVNKNIATSAVAFPQGSFSLEFHDAAIVSGNTTLVCTAIGLHTVYNAVLCGGLSQTAAPTFSGNTATFTFADPVASVFGKVILIGV